jgi:hypothetical protein
MAPQHVFPETNERKLHCGPQSFDLQEFCIIATSYDF